MPFLHPKGQYKALLLRAIVPALILVVCLTLLAACGKKPSQVDPPASAVDKVFPREYPNPQAGEQP